jgi:transcriptional regulator with GAF, ATPase, and Fis domain
MPPPEGRPGSHDATPDPEDLLAGAIEAVDRSADLDRLLLSRRQEERIQALETARDRLLLLLDIAGGLHRVDRVEDLLERVLDSALRISGGDRAYLLQKNEDGTLRIAAARGNLSGPDPAESLGDMSHTVLERVLDGGRTLYVSDALQNPDFMAQRSVRELSLRTVLAVPLPGPDGVAGALYVDSRSAAGLLEADGVELLEALAAQAALALETAQHRQHLVDLAEALQSANRTLRRALGERTAFDQILGRSPAMQRVFQVLDRVVGNSVSVLIQGETGTGKELVAQALHFQGQRREANFIPVNCGAIPEALLESELFGYSRGAFTGAERDHAGLVESAHGGTLFLDEIAELSLPLQVKLLRMLQQGEVRRLGETTSRRVDVRIITATHRDLEALVAEDRFREDLFYRINVVTVRLPPLRERGEDVIFLAETFLERVREKIGRPKLQFGRDAHRLLQTHPWPGNVRELMNAVERAGALATSDLITPLDLLPGSRAESPLPEGPVGALKDTLLYAEESAIRRALIEAEDNVSLAARRLGVSRQHLHTRIRRFGIRHHT